MQTIRLCSSGVFSTTMNSAGCSGSMLSSEAAALPSESSNALKLGFTQARATSLAPLAGERASM